MIFNINLELINKKTFFKAIRMIQHWASNFMKRPVVVLSLEFNIYKHNKIVVGLEDLLLSF